MGRRAATPILEEVSRQYRDQRGMEGTYDPVTVETPATMASTSAGPTA